MELSKRDQAKNTIALFRYGLISPIVNNTYEEKSKEDYYRKVASITYVLNGKNIKVSSGTIKKWFISYKKLGYEGLMPKTRTDLNTSRKLTLEAHHKIIDYKNSLLFLNQQC